VATFNDNQNGVSWAVAAYDCTKGGVWHSHCCTRTERYSWLLTAGEKEEQSNKVRMLGEQHSEFPASPSRSLVLTVSDSAYPFTVTDQRALAGVCNGARCLLLEEDPVYESSLSVSMWYANVQAGPCFGVFTPVSLTVMTSTPRMLSPCQRTAPLLQWGTQPLHRLT
jgi:hypothetical protein